jgi:hypothetical protein
LRHFDSPYTQVFYEIWGQVLPGCLGNGPSRPDPVLPTGFDREREGSHQEINWLLFDLRASIAQQEEKNCVIEQFEEKIHYRLTFAKIYIIIIENDNNGAK